MTAKLDKIADQIRILQKKTAADVIRIGRKLIRARRLLKHCDWGPWLEDKLGWDYQTAIRYTRVAQLAEAVKSNNLLNLAPSILYLISAPSIPEFALSEVVRRAAAGERITMQTAKIIIAEAEAETSIKRGGSVTANRPTVSEITVKISVGAFAKCLRENFEPKEIHQIYDRAVHAKPRRNSFPMLDAVRWVKSNWERLPKEILEYGLLRYAVADEFIYASNYADDRQDILVAGAPFPCGRNLIIPCANAFDEFVELCHDPVITIEDEVMILTPGDATDEERTEIQLAINWPEKDPEYFEGISPPQGKPFPLPSDVAHSISLLGYFYKTRLHGGSLLCLDGTSIYFNESPRGCQALVDDMPWPESFAVPAQAAHFIGKKREYPVQLMIGEDAVFFIWENGAFLKAARSEGPQL